jgi:hypothetical protein
VTPSEPLRELSKHSSLPVLASYDLFFRPRSITRLLKRTGWQDVQVQSLTEPAWMGTDVADVMSYVSAMPMIRRLLTDLANDALTRRVLAAIADQYAARQCPDGVWVTAAAWLVTARRD